MSAFNPYAFNPFAPNPNVYNPYGSAGPFFPNNFAASLAAPPMVTGAPMGMALGGPNIGSLIGIQDPGTNMMLNMIMQPILAANLGPNFIPAQYKPTVNLHTQMQAQHMFGEHRRAMNIATKADERVIFEMIRGTTTIAGGKFGAREQEAAKTMASKVAPFIADMAMMNPEMTEKLFGGSTGFATIMARNMSLGGRYSTDPVTGRRGLSADTTGYMARSVFDKLYGPNANIQEMGGITAGRAGAMYDEMTRRGLLGGAPSRTEGINKLANNLNLTIDEVKKLPDLDNKLRELDASRVADKLKGMAKAVSAMQEIFGEMGHEGSIQEIMGALETVTQGNLQAMAPAQVEKMVRDTANTARMAGVSYPEYVKQMGVTASMADRAGVDRVFVDKVTNQTFLEQDASRRIFGDVRGFGISSDQKLQYMRTQLNLKAQKDPTTLNMGRIVRAVEEYGVKPEKGSMLERLYQVATGKVEATEADKANLLRITNQRGGINAFLSQQGVGASVLTSLGTNEASNTEAIAKYNLGERFGGAGQRSMNARYLGSALAPATSRVLDDPSFKNTSAKLRQFLAANQKQIAAAVSAALSNPSPADVENPRALIKKTIENFLKQNGIEVGPNDTQMIEALAGSYSESANSFARKRNMGGLRNMMILSSGQVAREAEFSAGERDQTTKLQSLLSGVGKGELPQRIVDLLKGATPGTTVKEGLAAILGYQNKDVVAKALGPELKAMEEAAAQLSKIDPNMPKAKQAEIRARAYEQLSKILGTKEFQNLVKNAPNAANAAAGAAIVQLGKLEDTKAATITGEQLKKEKEQDLTVIGMLTHRDEKRRQGARDNLNNVTIANLRKEIEAEKDPEKKKIKEARLKDLQEISKATPEELKKIEAAAKEKIKDAEKDPTGKFKVGEKKEPSTDGGGGTIAETLNSFVSFIKNIGQSGKELTDVFKDLAKSVKDIGSALGTKGGVVEDLVLRSNDPNSMFGVVNDLLMRPGGEDSAITAINQMKAPGTAAKEIIATIAKDTVFEVKGKIELESKDASLNMAAMPAAGTV